MAIQTTVLLLTLCSFNILFYLRLSAAVVAVPSVPALYIFGDSTADVGTNNLLPYSKARVNHLPYGIDLVPSNATGRFSNGFNTADFLAMMMGFQKSPPPFLSITHLREARYGANFASGAAGILKNTGSSFVQFVSMTHQIRQFRRLQSNLRAQMGIAATRYYLSKSVFFISIGSNDLFDAIAADGPVKFHTQKKALVNTLVRTYKSQIKTLYYLGARKFGVVSIPPGGCCPSHRRFNTSGGCFEELNDAALDFFHATEAMLTNLSHHLHGMKFALGNAHELLINFLKNPTALGEYLLSTITGFTEVETACCGGGRFNGETPCLPTSQFCSNRNEFLFWDLFHPTQAASSLAARTLFGGSTQFVTPINVAQLVAEN